MNYIELFAGCGGLSLGLESENFELLFANEISPMATETFAFNHLGENLEECVQKNILPKKTFWLNSQYPQNKLKERLRENPFETPTLKSSYNDLSSDPQAIHKGIVTGNIVDFNNYLEENSTLTNLIKNGFGDNGVDLVSGGPPCQGFSMAGLRKHDNKRNQLPWEFARFVELVQPKIALLENVTGILRAFNVDGEKVYPWFEVAKAFSSIGYVPICLHINAKYVGIAQNRPRFMMIAIRDDFFDKILSKTQNTTELSIFHNAQKFYKQIQGNNEVNYGTLACWDIEKDSHVFTNTFFSPLFKYKKDEWRTIVDAIDDLRGKGTLKISNYVKEINSSFGEKFSSPMVIKNFELRKNTTLVKSRFQLYQILTKIDKKMAKEVSSFLKNQEVPLSELTAKEMLKYEYREIETSNYIKFQNQELLEEHLKTIKTKKITQKALVPENPAPAALTIPDDTCHYHQDELRTLTVREMARIQSFPDGFVFRSKVTTGGKMRRYEVPQYTQVGNAVPPLLGKAMGKVISNLINLSK